MLVSLNTVKQFTDANISVDDLVAKINQQLGTVKEVVDLKAVYSGAVIVKVESCQKHANADKLNVCQVNDGSGELTQVVCGAPNVHAGMYAVWLKPGAVVPSTAGDAEPFVLGARELRGVMSNGMLASPKELGLGDSHDGILEIDPSEPNPSSIEIKPGVSFAEAFGLDDTTIEIENKMFTHRPDLFGQLGVAREIAGIQQQPFASPHWYTTDNSDESKTGDNTLKLAVFNEAGSKVPRFSVVVIKDVEVKPSPLWLQAELRRLGSKSINNIVDATNYIMLLTAQPTHAYDYNKIRGSKLGARMANDKETVSLLNGKTYELTPDDIVIADAEGPVGLGGIMGGKDSEVSNSTSSIVLEVANFDMYAVRKSSMRHGVFTDALTRFNKGQSPLQNHVVLGYLMRLIGEVAGGSVAGPIEDLHEQRLEDRTSFVSATFINERLGLGLTKKEIDSLLRNVEFEICESCDAAEHDGDTIHYGVPFWRTDIELPEDIVEEVGRLYGFDNIPRELPQRSAKAASKNLMLALKHHVREQLARAGANEVLTYSFVHEKTLLKAGQDASQAFKLSNALSPELQYYRYSPLPSLLEKVHPNIKSGYDTFVLFELGKGHNKQTHADDNDGLPSEPSFIDAVFTSKKPLTGAPFYQAKRYVSHLLDSLGIEAKYNSADMAPKPYDTHRSAMIVTEEGEYVGVVGELDVAVLKAFKLPEYTACFTIDTDALLGATKRTSNQYRPLSRYPSVTQDVSLKVALDVPFSAISLAAQAVIDELDATFAVSFEPISIYAPDDQTTKTITLRLVVENNEKTLSDEAVRPIIQAIADKAADTCDAVMV